MNNSGFLSPRPLFPFRSAEPTNAGMKSYSRINTIPRPLAAVITLARKAFAGAVKSGPATGLAQNTPEKIGAELHDVIGNAATPEILGKQARYAAQLVAVKAAYAEKAGAIRAGREFCRLAISLLRPTLGNGWNTAWQAAGFHLPSLALPAQPVAILTALRAYFRANPARENAQANITAAAAEAAAAAIDAATLAVATERRALVLQKAQRDRALKTLRQRLSGLRAELEQLLDDDSGQWYEFGFRRPADGRKPAPVSEVTVAVAAPGVVLAQWEAAPLAKDYRVTVKLSNGEPVAETLWLADRQATLTGVPTGESVVVGVIARNLHGETRPTERLVTPEETISVHSGVASSPHHPAAGN